MSGAAAAVRWLEGQPFSGNWIFRRIDIWRSNSRTLEARMMIRDPRFKAFAHGVFAALLLSAVAVALAPERRNPRGPERLEIASSSEEPNCCPLGRSGF